MFLSSAGNELRIVFCAGSGVVTDISSGREMSLEEFDRALGLHTALEVCHSLTNRTRLCSACMLPCKVEMACRGDACAEAHK